MSNREENLYIDDEYYDMNSQGRQSTQPDTETGSEMEEDTVEQNTAVSYTHLTLPTIYSV